MKKPVLISGIQPSGKLHLGNYLGALKNFVDLQNSDQYDCYFFIADYHSITEDFDPRTKRRQIEELVADYLAVGLDPKKSTIFLQSDVQQTTELAWILATLTSFGELRRMTQFKDKSDAQPENINIGLFTYPVLMAADILLYNAAEVPVGDDQLQHLELTRTIARNFNKRFGQTFIGPKALLTANPRLMSLDNPTKKMSKSHPNGCIFLDDDPEQIETKIKTAVTDSETTIKYDAEHKPGISNLLSIIQSLSGKSIADIEAAFAGKNYSEFKHACADEIVDYFKKFRKMKARLVENTKKLNRVLAMGRKHATKIATATMEVVKQKIGLA